MRTLRIGEKSKANNGMEMTIVAYRSSADIDIQFEDGNVVKNKRYQQFKKGEIANPNIKNESLRNDRIGEEVKAKNGLRMKIIAYRNANDIDVQFEDGVFVKNRSYANFRKGSIRNPFINS